MTFWQDVVLTAPPYSYTMEVSGKFPHWLAAAVDALGKKGSNVNEVNQWLWQFGLGKPNLGGLRLRSDSLQW